MKNKNNTTKRLIGERRHLSHRKFIFSFLIFKIYACDNFSDLRSEVDDGIISFGNTQNTQQLLSYAFEKFRVFSPNKCYRPLQSQGRDILQCFIVH